MAKILIVEDDKQLSALVVDWLTGEKYATEVVFKGTEGLERLRVYQYDVVILDWELPGMSGLDICRQFRERGGTTPILMLTGKKEIDQKAEGLDAGSDDYLTKPFEMKELSARLRALLRRANPATKTPILSAGNLTLDPSSRKVTLGEKILELQPKEYLLLEFLLRHPNQPFNAEALMERVWTASSEAAPDTVRLHVMRLRNKIDEPGRESIIRTMHRVGYMLVPPQR